VDAAQEPAEGSLEVQIEQALIRAVRRRHVDKRQADAGRDLQHEQCERRAAEDIPPARRTAWDGVVHHGCDGAAEARALLEPAECRTDEAAARAHTGLESVGSCPPRTRNPPSRT